jgi:putative oxidoreductase
MFDALFRFDPCARFDPLAKDSIMAMILRVTLGAIFLYHGIDKITGQEDYWGTTWAATRHLKQADTNPDTHEFKPAPASQLNIVAQLAVAWGELLAGFAFVFGFLTRFAAVGVIIIQCGAIYIVTSARGFSGASGGDAGYEYNVAIIAMCVVLFAMGGGALSLDRWLARKSIMAATQGAGRAPASAPTTNPPHFGQATTPQQTVERTDADRPHTF